MLYKSTQGSLGIVKRSSKLGRFFDFFTTPSGRRVSLWLTGAGAFGLGAINFFPNTFFLKQYSYYLQLQSYVNRFPVKIENNYNTIVICKIGLMYQVKSLAK